jgi:hypothetical protein
MLAVYVDDFLLVAVENAQGTLLKQTARATLHAIHSMFQPPNAAGMDAAKDPVSEKELAQGDVQCDTHKEILGYCLDGKNCTM